MGGLFTKDVETVVREQKRILERAIRQMEREKLLMERSLKRVTLEMQRQARLQQMMAVKSLAKDYVQTQKQVVRLTTVTGQLRRVSIQMTTAGSMAQIVQSIRTAGEALREIQSSLAMPELQSVLIEFERNSQQLSISSELLGESMDTALGEDEEDEKETNEIIQRVLDEMRMQTQSSLAEVPTNTPGTTATSLLSPSLAAASSSASLSTSAAAGDSPPFDSMRVRDE